MAVTRLAWVRRSMAMARAPSAVSMTAVRTTTITRGRRAKPKPYEVTSLEKGSSPRPRQRDALGSNCYSLGVSGSRCYRIDLGAGSLQTTPLSFLLIGVTFVPHIVAAFEIAASPVSIDEPDGPL